MKTQEEKTYSSELSESLNKFKTEVEELQAIVCSQAIATWDIETKMPKGGAEYRAWVVSILTKLSHERLTSKTIGELLNYLREEKNYNLLNKIDKAIVREIGRSFDKEVKIPAKLVQELSELTSRSHIIWANAKEKKDYSLFKEHFEKIVSLKIQSTDYIGYKDSPYDALLDSYEPNLTAKELDKIFSNLKEELISLIKNIKNSSVKINKDFLNQRFNHLKQLELSKELLKHIGYDFHSGRLDEANHPFTIGLGPNDVRVTTRIHENNLLSGIGSSIHEGGHALYELGVNPSLSKHCIGSGASLGIHESQSRLYETIIGQGLSFWEFYFPKLQETFKDELKSVSLVDFYNAINFVEPTFIRVDSDEVTYNLHIVIRYEIEKDLIERKISVSEVPEIWNEKMEKYLGIRPGNDAEGALQDVHWAWGAIGYFPTYSIGNLCAAQFYNTLKHDVKDIEKYIAEGNMTILREWLKEKIHFYGMTETPNEIIERVTGEPINSKYFINYLKQKYSLIYKL